MRDLYLAAGLNGLRWWWWNLNNNDNVFHLFSCIVSFLFSLLFSIDTLSLFAVSYKYALMAHNCPFLDSKANYFLFTFIGRITTCNHSRAMVTPTIAAARLVCVHSHNNVKRTRWTSAKQRESILTYANGCFRTRCTVGANIRVHKPHCYVCIYLPYLLLFFYGVPVLKY